MRKRGRLPSVALGCFLASVLFGGSRATAGEAPEVDPGAYDRIPEGPPAAVELEASDDPGSPLPVPRTSAEITVDGRVGEAEWSGAAAVPLRYETRPGENVAPPVETEALITYDSEHLYVAFRASDPEPRAIRAHLLDRDSAWDDDFAGIVVDPFNDERRAFEFFANPLGVQMDLFNDDVERIETDTWDAIWDSAGRITESGYEIEMAIPFHQLRFPRREGKQVWGIDLIRFYPRSSRHRIASQPLDRNLNCYLCQISKMEGFEDLDPGRNLEVVPTLVGGVSESRRDFPDGELEGDGLEAEPGVSVRWGFTPNLSLNATVNPDFSQVEADVAQLEVNNQFALFFPEKRPFFLEGADFFDTRFDTVFTRNVVSPSWGVKLTGKEGANGVGVFVAEDDVTSLIFPGSQGSDGDTFDFESTDAALRYRRDFGRSSAIGAVFTGREGGDYSSYLGGVDGLYRFGESNSINFQILSSETRYPVDVAADFEQPGGTLSDTAFRFEYDRSGRDWGAWFDYIDVGGDFRADLGFMPRVDYRQVIGGLRHRWWGGEDDWYDNFAVGGDYDVTEDQGGQELERELELWAELSGPLQSFVFVDVGTRDRHFDGVDFDDQPFVFVYGEVQPTGDLYLELELDLGETIDFDNTRAADVLTVNPELRYNLGDHLRISVDHTHRRLDVDGGRLFEADLSQLRLVWQFDVRTFVRGIFQYQSIERDPDLYVDEVDASSEDLLTQLLFSYKLNPQTVLFVGYSESREGFVGATETVDLLETDRTLFVKIGYAWNL